jgi:hypothetical protein
VPTSADEVMRVLQERGVPAQRLGSVGGDALAITVGEEKLRWPIREIFDDWFHSIGAIVRES